MFLIINSEYFLLLCQYHVPWDCW